MKENDFRFHALMTLIWCNIGIDSSGSLAVIPFTMAVLHGGMACTRYATSHLFK